MSGIKSAPELRKDSLTLLPLLRYANPSLVIFFQTNRIHGQRLAKLHATVGADEASAPLAGLIRPVRREPAALLQISTTKLGFLSSFQPNNQMGKFQRGQAAHSLCEMT